MVQRPFSVAKRGVAEMKLVQDPTRGPAPGVMESAAHRSYASHFVEAVLNNLMFMLLASLVVTTVATTVTGWLRGGPHPEPIFEFFFWLVASLGTFIMWVGNGCASAVIEAQNRKRRQATEALREAHNWLTPCLIIDSNVWMDSNFGAFFAVLKVVCERRSHQLRLMGQQLDEITNVKDRVEYTNPRSKAARLAIARIEELQKAGLLSIDSVSVRSNPSAYADPIILQSLKASVADGVPCTLISNDVELRIRVREHLSKLPPSTWTILEGEKLLEECQLVVSELLSDGCSLQAR